LAGGQGRLTTDSRVLDDARYSFRTRFGDEAGTNPEELIAAAHAGCFSMALAFYLEKAGMSPELIQTTAELTLQQSEGGPTIEGIHLRTTARVPDAHTEEFRRVAEQAKDGCLVSRLLNTRITLEAVLEQPNPALRE
jgi:osmotically inducible protein OsmC